MDYDGDDEVLGIGLLNYYYEKSFLGSFLSNLIHNENLAKSDILSFFRRFRANLIGLLKILRKLRKMSRNEEGGFGRVFAKKASYGSGWGLKIELFMLVIHFCFLFFASNQFFAVDENWSIFYKSGE